MKWTILAAILVFCSCSKNDDAGDDNESIYKVQMRQFVIGISKYAKNVNQDFAIIPQNGLELVSSNGALNGAPALDYLNAIDANGQEDLYYGYDADDVPTQPTDNLYLRGFLNISKAMGKKILVTDYCSTNAKMSDSYQQNTMQGYVSFAANNRELSNIPTFPAKIQNENNAMVTKIADVQNFLYLINPAQFPTKQQFIDAVTSTNYDLIIMDLFMTDGAAYTASEIEQLKNKQNGGKRMVVAYMSIGEAENYRYYWEPAWNNSKPFWVDAENPDWPGNFTVKYWDADWQKIIYGNNNSYLDKILNSHFDGVYLDIIDAFQYYEEK